MFAKQEKDVCVCAQVPTHAYQESRSGFNSCNKHVFQGGSLVHILCSVVSWRLWERCQRARLCGGGKGGAEHDRQLLQRANHQELGGEHSRWGLAVVVHKLQYSVKMFSCSDFKSFLAGKKLDSLCTFEVTGEENTLPLFEASYVCQKDTTTTTLGSVISLPLKLLLCLLYVQNEIQTP